MGHFFSPNLTHQLTDPTQPTVGPHVHGLTKSTHLTAKQTKASVFISGVV